MDNGFIHLLIEFFGGIAIMKRIQTYRRLAVKLGIVCLFVLFQGQYVFSATSTTPQTLDEINKEVSPGSIVLLESGTYTTPIAPASFVPEDAGAMGVV